MRRAVGAVRTRLVRRPVESIFSGRHLVTRGEMIDRTITRSGLGVENPSRAPAERMLATTAPVAEER